MTPVDQPSLHRSGPTPRGTLLFWAAVTASMMLAVHLAVFALDASAFAAFALFAAGVAVLWWRIPTDYPHTRFGACNAVTLLRAGLGATLVTPLISAAPMTPQAEVWANEAWAIEAWAVVLIALVALLLDGVDGLLARRSGLSSSYGARFDMEVDAALSLILMAHVLMDGTVGPYVVVLGIMRYLFIGASVFVPWLSAPLPERFGRKLVCVIQVAALIVLQIPVLPVSLVHVIAIGASLALLWSFGRDTFWLWRHRS